MSRRTLPSTGMRPSKKKTARPRYVLEVHGAPGWLKLTDKYALETSALLSPITYVTKRSATLALIYHLMRLTELGWKCESVSLSKRTLKAHGLVWQWYAQKGEYAVLVIVKKIR